MVFERLCTAVLAAGELYVRFKKTGMLPKSNKVLHIAISYVTIVQKNMIGGKYNGDRSKSFQ